MPRNREEADLFFCSVTPLQNVRNENLERIKAESSGCDRAGARDYAAFLGFFFLEPS